MNQSQDADGDGVTELVPRAYPEAGGPGSVPMFADGSESSGCVSYDTVVDVENAPRLTAAFEKQQGDWSSIKRLGSISRKQSKESASTVEKKPSAWKSLRKTTSALSGKPVAVRKKNDPLMTKFKFSLQKYNKSLKTTTDGQLSLKYMHDKLVKLRQELLQTGNYQEEELIFDSPNFKDIQQCEGLVPTIGSAPANRRSSIDLKKLEVEKEALAVKLSELEQQNRELEEMIKSSSKVTAALTPSPTPDYLLNKNLRAKIKCTTAKALENEQKLEELKIENDLLKQQLFESKTAVDELKVLHMQVTLKHQEALDEIEEMNKEVEMRNEETKNLNAKMFEKLSKLKSEYETFQMENEIFRKMIEELQLDYNETLTKCKEASKTWEAINDKYVSQKQMKDAIASDFVKLGVSYKKLQLAFEELVSGNAKLREQVGAQSVKLCKKSPSYRCLHRKGHDNHTSKQVPRQRRVAVQTSDIEISSVTAMVGKTGSAQYCGDGMVRQQCENKPYRERIIKLEREIEGLREENSNHLEKHKLLIRQVLRLDKQCHLQHTENRKQLRLVDELKGNSKHLEEEVTVLRNKHAQTEARKCSESTKKLPSDSSSSKTKRSKMNYVIVKKASSKNVIPHSNTKRTWLKSFWSKENKIE